MMSFFNNTRVDMMPPHPVPPILQLEYALDNSISKIISDISLVNAVCFQPPKWNATMTFADAPDVKVFCTPGQCNKAPFSPVKPSSKPNPNWNSTSASKTRHSSESDIHLGICGQYTFT